MFKRLILFFATNLLVVLTITLILAVFKVGDANTLTGLFVLCLVWGMVGAFISLGLSRIMAKWFMGVKVVDPRQPGGYMALLDMVHELAGRAKLPAMPQVGVYESPEVNAFATGPTRSRALVAVSTGLLRRMSPDQIEGVLGHEIAHIANGDMVTMTLIQGVVNAFVMFLARVIAFALTQSVREESRRMVNWVVVMVLEMGLSLLGFIVVAWFSRRREFRADQGGATFAGKAKMLGALQALNTVYGQGEAVGKDRPTLATLKISGKPSGFLALMSTHPPLETRIARLQAQA